MQIGFQNYVPWWRVVSILAPGGLAMKRLRDESYQKGLLVDATHNRRTRAIIVIDSQHVILSSVAVETLQGRLEMERRAGSEGPQAGTPAPLCLGEQP